MSYVHAERAQHITVLNQGEHNLGNTAVWPLHVGFGDC